MAKKKSKQPPSKDGKLPEEATQEAVADQPVCQSCRPQWYSGTKTKEEQPESIPRSLLICRNKHWRYISVYNGAWTQMSIETLEAFAHISYNTPRPRPVDAGLFFDLVKIRRLVDEATNLAVRAQSDVASSILTTVNGSLMEAGGSGLGGPSHTAKLSRERKFRMREQASQRLARAYRLDEVASSVATMQGSSTLEEVAGLVLNRNPQDPDAKYVHFFHEKIPSRQLSESTSTVALEEIVIERADDVEVLRTRGVVKTYKEDLDGAILDFNAALVLLSRRMRLHSFRPETRTGVSQRPPKRAPDIILAEKDQPTGLQCQIFFHRAKTYLALACKHIYTSDWINLDDFQIDLTAGSSGLSKRVPSDKAPGENDDDRLKRQMDVRRLIKTLAKRALRDYLSFLSHFEYSPNYPTKFTMDLNERLNLAVTGSRNTRIPDTLGPVEPHTIYALSDLFVPVPPSNLPPFPTAETLKPSYLQTPPQSQATCEVVTFHPLISDALHSLLLCHALLQTSPTELLRHAHMVARLVRLADGYPIFSASRTAARSDWIIVVRRTENWLNLDAPWNTLCAPAPLPYYDPTQPQKGSIRNRPMPKVTGSLPRHSPSMEDDLAKMDIYEQAMLDAFDNEDVTDEASFNAAVEAAEKEHTYDLTLFQSTSSAARGADTNPHPQRWSKDIDRSPMLTSRASAIAEWVRQAPVVPAVAKRKKKPKKAKETLSEDMEKLTVEAEGA